MLVPFCSSFKAPQELNAKFSISNIEAFIHHSIFLQTSYSAPSSPLLLLQFLQGSSAFSA
jgi:hypothetical protein